MHTDILIKIAVIIFNLFALVFLSALFIIREKAKTAELKRFLKFLIIFTVGLLIAQYIFYFDTQYIEPNWIQVKKVQIEGDKFSDSLKKLKIVHISDLHIKKYGFREKALLRHLWKIWPDVILITGDLITSRKYFPLLTYVLGKMKARLGIYIVAGDNDTSLVLPEFKNALKEKGVMLLDNSNVKINLNEKEGLWIIGFTDEKLDKNIMSLAYEGINYAEPKIVLTHYPETIDSDYITKERADLILSGGTHGGQTGIHFLRKLSYAGHSLKYVAGLYIIKGIPLYVNKGIGTVGDGKRDTSRFFCRPEITFIKLKSR
ncbi:MAG: metallophosphoesterase [Candidatus Omnitrophica bacterium]|nr:metallophosphoesterase [Candidatus Omnitrophota bacterium]